MDKCWLKSYPDGVAHTIDVQQFSSLVQMLNTSFKQHADKPYAVCMERWMTYGEVDTLSTALAAWLQAQGLEPGARVAIMLPNIPQFSVAMAAVLRAGYVCVNVNPLYTPRELEHQLKDSGASVIVILENFARTLEEVVGRTAIRHVVLANMGDLLGLAYGSLVNFVVRRVKKLVPAYNLPSSATLRVTPFNKALAAGRALPFKPASCSLDSTAFLQYTGGTTGLSKGAILTHGNIVAAMLQTEAWFRPALAKVGETHKINCVMALPLYHIFALTLCFMSIRLGSHMTLVPNPRDFGNFISTLKKRPFHLLPAVNTLFNALLQQPEFKTVDFSSLCVSQAGGMAASEGTAQRWMEVTGCPMIEGWGMTETCAVGTDNPVLSKTFSGSIGLPLPSVDIVIKDDEGQDLPIGAQGEICIKGPNVTVGYYQQPEETASAFTADGYLRTGDIGMLDARGYVRIVDRKKDMILVSGFNVFPNELENVISLCPGVVECAAIGVPDERQGEAIKVFVVKNDPALSEADVLTYCHKHLTGYKQPKSIVFRDALPKSNVGKILRRELRNPTA